LIWVRQAHDFPSDVSLRNITGSVLAYGVVSVIIIFIGSLQVTSLLPFLYPHLFEALTGFWIMTQIRTLLSSSALFANNISSMWTNGIVNIIIFFRAFVSGNLTRGFHSFKNRGVASVIFLGE
jgi:hypothetical protein